MRKLHNQEDDNHEDSMDWSPTSHYSHVPNHHPKSEHRVTVMDPFMANPNSKFDVNALCNLIKTEAPIDAKNDRIWTYMAADAAIALKVCFFP